MKTPGAALQGGLAALGLIAAYTTWQRAPEHKAGEVVLVDATQNDVQKIRYEDNTTTTPKWVELDRRQESDGPRVWLKVSPRPADPKHPAWAAAPERELRGNEQALKVFEKFAPLRATRALGVLSADKMKEVGLDAPKKHLEVTANGVKHSYAIGLVSRVLHDWRPIDFDALTITVGDKKRELSQTGAEVANGAKLVSKSGRSDEMAKNWHDRLWRVLVTDVLGKGETPADGEPVIALRIDYTQRGHKRGFLEIGRVSGKAPAPAASGVPAAPAPVELFARTESTAGWVKLGGNADQLVKEADKIAAAAD
jgi:hypothetical protein